MPKIIRLVLYEGEQRWLDKNLEASLPEGRNDEIFGFDRSITTKLITPQHPDFELLEKLIGG